MGAGRMRAGRASFEEMFAWACRAEQLCEVYDWVLGAGALG